MSHREDTMKTCPNCGFQCEPTDTECPKCGIIFEKWEAVESRKREEKKDNVASEGEENSDLILEPLTKCQKCGILVDPVLDKCPSCGGFIRGDQRKRFGRAVYLGGLIIIALVKLIPQISELFEKGPEERRANPAQTEAGLKEKKRVQKERFLSGIDSHYQRAAELFNAKEYGQAKNELRLFFDFDKEDYKSVLLMYNKIRVYNTSRIDELERKAKELPEYRLSEHIEIYKQLFRIDPANVEYSTKIAQYTSKYEEQKRKNEEQARKLEEQKRRHEEQNREEKRQSRRFKASNANPIDLCVCLMLRTLNGENHNDDKCDFCGKRGGLLDNVKRKFLCGRTYELHSKCAGIILDKCEGL